jgi:hypothetical protein
MIATGGTALVEYDYSKDLDIHVYELNSKEIYLYDETGRKRTKISAQKDAYAIKIKIEGENRGINFVFHNLSSNSDEVIKESDVNGFSVKLPAGAMEMSIKV